MYFAAYPANPEEISQSIEKCERKTNRFKFQSWRTLVGTGGLIDTNILPVIQQSDGLIADLTYGNNNVFFEIGYAMGCKKPIIPIINSSHKSAASYLNKLGLFDNVIQIRYENSEDLSHQLLNLKTPNPIFVEETAINTKQPVFLSDAYRRSEFAAKIVSSIKQHVVSFRTHDPQEDYRLSLRSAWSAVCQSTGIVVSVLSNNKDDYELHNFRASFLSGLGIALSKNTLILLDSDATAPLDFIDNVKRIKHPDDIGRSIKLFGTTALSEAKREELKPFVLSTSALSRANAGAAAAENELRKLENYFVETAAYRTALEGRGRLVVGRKGTGKTAIFWRVRDTLRYNNRNTVVDLKPDGYQLRKFKEELIKLLKAGTKDHTLTAFWEFLILTEILLKVLDDDIRKFYGRDEKITEALDKLHDIKDRIEHGQEGDFSERMMSLITQVSSRFKSRLDPIDADTFLSSTEITELLHSYNIKEMRESVFELLSLKERTVVLFDNVDKGWGAHGVDNDDISLVSTLIDAFRKIERMAAKQEIEFHWLLLLRNDVYELLIDRQSDRGKEDRISVDWDSKPALKQVIENRINYSTADPKGQNGQYWMDLCPIEIDGQKSMDWLIDRCVRKPRYLIKLVTECVGIATTTQSDTITADHLIEGYRLFSFDALENTNLDMRDVFPPIADAVYSFIGMPRKLNQSDVRQLLLDHGHHDENIDEIIRMLFWYGFLGFMSKDGAERYIYDYRYNEKIFTQSKNTSTNKSEDIVINLAFSGALECLE